MPASQYEIPRWGTPADRLLGWLMEANQEGQAWLNSQRPAVNWPAAVALMEDADSATVSTEMSNTQYPKAKRIARELVASLSSFRHHRCRAARPGRRCWLRVRGRRRRGPGSAD